MEWERTTLLRACMIDGFGSFKQADYRRSWLFFDDVDYVLPHELRGPIELPPLEDSREFAVCRNQLAPDVVEHLLELTRRDMEDPVLRDLVATRVPANALEYAAVLVWSDIQVRDHIRWSSQIDPVLFLLNKLLWFSACRDLVPIAGCGYATELLAQKLRQTGTGHLGHNLLSARGTPMFATFAAGLSFDFVTDTQLVAAPISRLIEFKQRHRDLLARHQLQLVEVAEAFAALSEGADFHTRVTQLRLQARRERLELEERARDAWVEVGLDLTKKAIVAATAGAFSGLAVLRGHSWSDVLAASLPAAVAAGGVVLSSIVDHRAKARAKATPMAYLFRAAEHLS
jgi:hypothetical protein